MRRVLAWGGGTIFFGVLLNLFSLYIEAEPSFGLSHRDSILVQFLDNLGVGLISLGLLGVMVDLPDWRKYFQDRLAEIVVDRSYLRTLGDAELIALQTSTLEAFFKVDDIDREGSLLHHFHETTQRLVASPFREDTTVVMRLLDGPRDDCFVVDDSITYTCRKVGTAIQPDVRWLQQPGEHLQVDSFEIELQLPRNATVSFLESEGLVSDDGLSCCYGAPRIEAFKIPNGYRMSLERFKDCDGLKITIRSKYLIARDRFISWTMAHPTHRFNFTLSHPVSLSPASELFGIDESDVSVSSGNGLFTATCLTWSLPNTGIVVQLRAPDFNPTSCDSQTIVAQDPLAATREGTLPRQTQLDA